MKDSNTPRVQAKRLAIVVSLIVLMGTVLLIDHFNKASQSSDAATSTLTPDTPVADAPVEADATVSPSTASSTSSSYKDGTYSATSEYDVPRSYESIKVNLTVKDGKVVASSIANSEGDPKSAVFQEDFAARYKPYVIGRDLSSLDLPYIAGASDTTDGFNAAVAKIKSQAKA